MHLIHWYSSSYRVGKYEARSQICCLQQYVKLTTQVSLVLRLTVSGTTATMIMSSCFAQLLHCSLQRHSAIIRHSILLSYKYCAIQRTLIYSGEHVS